MSTITAILEPDADGSLHLPLPPELSRGKIKVVAHLTSLAEDKTDHTQSAVRDWLQHAKGSVRLAPGETADDVRAAYYAEKYGPEA